ncbi:MAG: prepilin-type N-terminal cleavage/methylation domain-containing protein [Halomonas subglaciescola]|nr:prepilin-type N-terminal cleavage/methylation domain-containing protein [Halomonas subglaciescola]
MQVRTQQGFTLIEMMVAMVLGTVIILGAGHLFLTTFKTFQEVDALSRKQEAIVFSTQTIMSEIRKYHDDSDPDDRLYTIACKMEDSGCDCTIYDNRQSGTPEPVVSFPKLLQDAEKKHDAIDCKQDTLLYQRVDDELSYEVTLPLEAPVKVDNAWEPGNITFRVAHRDDVIIKQK